MVKIEVYDPAMCCSTGVCGVEVDQGLVTFAADVEWAKRQGVTIDRFNLGQQPLQFANNARVKRFLERSGEGALPLTLVDGEVTLAGRYPSRAELSRWAGVATAPAANKTGGSCCGGPCWVADLFLWKLNRRILPATSHHRPWQGPAQGGIRLWARSLLHLGNGRKSKRSEC